MSGHDTTTLPAGAGPARPARRNWCWSCEAVTKVYPGKPPVKALRG